MKALRRNSKLSALSFKVALNKAKSQHGGRLEIYKKQDPKKPFVSVSAGAGICIVAGECGQQRAYPNSNQELVEPDRNGACDWWNV